MSVGGSANAPVPWPGAAPRWPAEHADHGAGRRGAPGFDGGRRWRCQVFDDVARGVDDVRLALLGQAAAAAVPPGRDQRGNEELVVDRLRGVTLDELVDD